MRKVPHRNTRDDGWVKEITKKFNKLLEQILLYVGNLDTPV